MYIVEVIPMVALPPQVPQLLSYFFDSFLPKGSVVEISINNRQVPAVVVASSPIEERKASLKSSSFQLKKISKVLSEIPLVSENQFRIILWLSKKYYSPLGLCIKTVLPSSFLKIKMEPKTQSQLSSKAVAQKPQVLLSRASDIIKNIEPEIKKNIAAKKQVLVIVPEVSVAEYFHEYFTGLYETAIIHGKITPKKQYQNWQNISSGKAQVVVGTRTALFSQFFDLGLIIVEDPANEAYKSEMSPKYNTADLAQEVSNLYSCGLIFVSQIPDIENYAMIKSSTYELKKVSFSVNPKILVIDMLQELQAGNFSIISREFGKKILESIQKKEKVLIFSSRKGYSGAYVCENCRFQVKCPNCSIPLKFYKNPEPRLTCSRCLVNQKAPESCPNCHSYKLKAMGFPGTQKLEEALERLFFSEKEKPRVFVLDSGLIKTPKSEKEILKKMEALDSYICIATQMIFSHRYQYKFDLVGVPNVDSLTTIPDFQTEEQLFYQFEKLLDFQPKEVALQTLNHENPVLKSLNSEGYHEFYEQELPIRKMFWYPPYVRLIKLTFRHLNNQKALYEARILGEKLRMAIIQRKLQESVKIVGPSPAFIGRERGLYIYNIVLKILQEQKPEDILKFVPSHWNIDVDPKNIL